MKIALIGYGKMGKMIEALALEQNHEVVSIIDPSNTNEEICTQNLNSADVCIEFTHPDAVLDNIRKTLSIGKKIVVGTTGWESNLGNVHQWVNETDGALFHASNFSIGMHYFMKTLETAANLFLNKGPYDAAGLETHHRQKVDAPSGTAKDIQSVINNVTGQTIPFSSVRCGSVPGTHTIYLDSPADTITLTHQAHNRTGFANGAIAAAEWIQDKQGIYTMKDLLCCN